MTQNETRIVPCLICNSNDWRTISSKDRKASPLKTVLCNGCGLVRHAQVPDGEEVEKFYAVDYRRDYKNFKSPRRKHIYRAARGAARIFARLQPFLVQGSRGLDFGSGPGVKAYFFKMHGYDMSALEPGLDYAKYSAQAFELNVTSTTWEKAEFNTPFDFIICHHVLEHLTDPFAALARMNSWLKDGGVLFLAVPDLDEAFGDKAPDHFFHTAHIYNFNRETLTAVCHRAGFEIVDENDHQGRNTSFILRKSQEPLEDSFSKIPSNAEQLTTRFQEMEMENYYVSSKPAKKFSRKTLRYLKEWLVCLLAPDPTRIVQRFL